MQIATADASGPLGTWTMCEWRPPRLAGLVDRLWYSEGAIAMPGERIFPSGTAELVVNLGEPYRLVEGNGVRDLSLTTLSGLQSGPMVIAGPERHRVLGIRLTPAGSFALFGRPLHELTDLTVDLRDLLARDASELAERCHAARSPAACFAVAGEWLGERIARGQPIDEAIAWIAGSIERSRGTAAIGRLRERTGLSRTRLLRSFREQIGVAPKLYARILRLRHALELLHGGTGELADVALAAGYYDQPHMNLDFRELAGVTPREFLAMRYPSGDGSSVAQPL